MYICVLCARKKTLFLLDTKEDHLHHAEKMLHVLGSCQYN